MSFLYQIERKQAALLAARDRGDEMKAAKRQVTVAKALAKAEPVAVNIGVQMDPALSAAIEALVDRGVAPSKTAAVLAALQEYLAEHEYDETVAQAVRAPTSEVKRTTLGVELDAALNTRLIAFCKRFTCYKRRAAVAALTYYVEKHRERGARR